MKHEKVKNFSHYQVLNLKLLIPKYIDSKKHLIIFLTK